MSYSFRWTVCALAVLGLWPALRAHAFGGVWSTESAPVRATAAKILLVDSPGPTVTAVVQIEHEGPPQGLAWVIPVSGEPMLALSSRKVFERLETATAPEHWIEVAVEGVCKDDPDPDAGLDAGTANDAVPSAPDGMADAIAVLDRGRLGPYDYATIAVDPTLDDPAEAAIEWLTQNGYALTGLEGDVLRPYLAEGLDLLAVKLANGSEAGAIRPLMLTYESARPAIPIRPMAAAAQNRMGIQVWVIGPSQAVPRNYKSLVLNDALIDWLSGEQFVVGTLPFGGAGAFGGSVQRASNYDAVVTAAAREAGGRGFVTELGAPASQFRDQIWSMLDDENVATTSGQSYADGIEAVMLASNHYRGWDGFEDAVEGATELPAGVTVDELLQSPADYRGVIEIDTARFLELLQEQVVKPVSDTARLLYDAPYLTRLYTTMRPRDMTVDPAFEYNFELAQIRNVHVGKQRIECNGMVNRSAAPFVIELPQGGVVVGEGGEGGADWPLRIGSMPANLKIVMLSTSGPGEVLADNSALIGSRLREAAGTQGSGAALPQSPTHGVLIGGTQTVSYARTGSSSGNTCNVRTTGSRPTPAFQLWVLATLALTLKRRRPTSDRDGPAKLTSTIRVISNTYGSFRGFRGANWHGGQAPECQFSRTVPIVLWALWLGSACRLDGDGNGTAFVDDSGSGVTAVTALTPEQLRDPETCKGCHPIHYREWSGSMHAYSARDPVFLAMNQRGQRETNGELGDFCIKCHAPMAVVDKITPDGLDLPQLPDFERGVSCYFCHNVVAIEGDHNAMLRLANDTTMRGPISDPLKTVAHGAEYSELFDEATLSSSAMCGACHDIVTPTGVHLERTFREYQLGIFSKSATGEPLPFESCSGCHMPGRDAPAAAVANAPARTVHEHFWPGIDVALDDFPHAEAMRSAVEDCQLGLGVSFFTLEVTPPDLFTFQIQSAAGHNTPSGAAQDRRMWLEVLAYDDNGELLEEISSGNIADDELEEQPAGHPKHDPHLVMFRDRIFDALGKPVHMFWEAAKSQRYPEGYESHLLPVATTTYVDGKHAVIKQFRLSGQNGLPARVTARLRMRPIGLDVLQDLVDSGDLDPAIMARMPTFSFPAQIDWTRADGVQKTITAEPRADCTSYRCMLDPSDEGCQ